jgi:enoyl-CoA hydratase
VGTATALKMMLTGEMAGAAEALRLGLVDEVVPPEGLLARGQELAGTIAAAAPLAVKAALEAVRRGASLGIEDGTVVEAEIFGRLCGSEDRKEGTSAFLDKRKPVWSGR